MDIDQLQDWIDQLENEQAITQDQLNKARARMRKMKLEIRSRQAAP